MSETLNAAPAPHEEEHAALVDMLAADKEGDISPEDAQAYQELIDYNRDATREATTQIEVKDAGSEATSIVVHKSIGDRALSSYGNGLGMEHSGTWVTHEQDN